MIGLALPLGAQEKPAVPRKNALPKRVYHAVRLIGPPPKVDGKLDDACWTQGEWTGDFIQREPHEGQPGSQPTQLKILYDDKYVYVAIRAYDPCLGCATHSLPGHLPLKVSIYNRDRHLVQELVQE